MPLSGGLAAETKEITGDPHLLTLEWPGLQARDIT
jgi:hypothetical protein